MKNTTTENEVAEMLLHGMPDDMTLGDFRSYVTNWVNNKNTQEKNREESRIQWYQDAMDNGKCFKLVNNPNSTTYIHCFNNPGDDREYYSPSGIAVHGQVITVTVDESSVNISISNNINKYWLKNPYENTLFSDKEVRVTEITLEEFNKYSTEVAKMKKKLQSCL